MSKRAAEWDAVIEPLLAAKASIKRRRIEHQARVLAKMSWSSASGPAPNGREIVVADGALDGLDKWVAVHRIAAAGLCGFKVRMSDAAWSALAGELLPGIQLRGGCVDAAVCRKAVTFIRKTSPDEFLPSSYTSDPPLSDNSPIIAAQHKAFHGHGTHGMLALARAAWYLRDGGRAWPYGLTALGVVTVGDYAVRIAGVSKSGRSWMPTHEDGAAMLAFILTSEK